MKRSRSSTFVHILSVLVYLVPLGFILYETPPTRADLPAFALGVALAGFACWFIHLQVQQQRRPSRAGRHLIVVLRWAVGPVLLGAFVVARPYLIAHQVDVTHAGAIAFGTVGVILMTFFLITRY